MQGQFSILIIFRIKLITLRIWVDQINRALMMFINMKERNKAIVHRLLLQKNNNTSHANHIRNKFKKRLNHSNHSEDYLLSNNTRNALSHKNITRKKCYTNFVPMPSLAQLRKQVYIPSPKIFSQPFIGKIFDVEKSTFAVIRDRKEDQQSRDYSPRSIKQCLQQRIMENVKRHKQKERLPKIIKAIVAQKYAEKNYTEELCDEKEKFVIWEKKQKDEIVRISINTPSQSLLTNRVKRLSKQFDKSQELSSRKRQKYAYFKDFTPWTKNGQLQQI